MKKPGFDTIIFIVLSVFLGLGNLFNTDKPAVSEIENRVLSKMPEMSSAGLRSGQYFMDFENYYNDTFLFRERFVRVSRDIKGLLSFGANAALMVSEKEEIAVLPEQHGDIKDAGAEPAGAASDEILRPTASFCPSPSPTPEPVPTPTPIDTDREQLGYWLVKDGQAVELFEFDKQALENYADTLNYYREKLDPSIRIFSIIAPSAYEFSVISRYAGDYPSQNEAMEYLSDRFAEGVENVNVFEALSRHKDEYLFFRTDHHWTARGAYYAYEAFRNIMHGDVIPLEQYERTEITGYLGSFYRKTLDKDMEKNPDTIELFHPFEPYTYMAYDGNKELKLNVLDMDYATNGKDKYLIFLSTGVYTWMDIKTEADNGRRILAVKSSYGNTLVPFLLPHYEEILVVDHRFYNSKWTGMDIIELIMKNEIDEVMFVNYISDINSIEFVNKIRSLIEDD